MGEPSCRASAGASIVPAPSTGDRGGMICPPFSQLLRRAGDAERESVPLGELMTIFGSRAHGTALLLLALPEAVPLPLPSASAVLAVPLILVAGHLAVSGEGAELPRRAARFPVPQRVLRAAARWLSPALRRMERLSRPRWLGVARRERLVGGACLALSIILLLPLPLVNAPPAALLVLLSWGLIQQDGAAVAIGLVGTAALTAALAAVAWWAVQADLPPLLAGLTV